MRRFTNIAHHFISGGVLLFYCGSNRVGNPVDLVDHLADGGDCIDGRFGVALNGFNLAADVLGGFSRLLSQFLHFVCDYSEAFASFARAGRFNGCIQSQQIGLLRD